MSISNKFRTLEENGESYFFNYLSFKKLVKERKVKLKIQGQKITQEQIIEQIANKTYTSIDAVKNWQNGYNGPSDISIVKAIAGCLSVDYHDLLIKKPNFNIDSCGEKNIVKYFYKLLTEFIYTYVGGDNSIEIIEDSSLDVKADYEKINAYIFELYRLLDTVALDISTDTYNKLHRYIAECRALSRLGDESITPYFSNWPKQNKRWREINPRLYAVTCIVDECFDDNYKEQVIVQNSYIGETGFKSFIDDPRYSDERHSEIIKQFIPSEYELLIMEFSRTLTLLFRVDFPELFK